MMNSSLYLDEEVLEAITKIITKSFDGDFNLKEEPKSQSECTNVVISWVEVKWPSEYCTGDAAWGFLNPGDVEDYSRAFNPLEEACQSKGPAWSGRGAAAALSPSDGRGLAFLKTGHGKSRILANVLQDKWQDSTGLMERWLRVTQRMMPTLEGPSRSVAYVWATSQDICSRYLMCLDDVRGYDPAFIWNALNATHANALEHHRRSLWVTSDSHSRAYPQNPTVPDQSVDIILWLLQLDDEPIEDICGEASDCSNQDRKLKICDGSVGSATVWKLFHGGGEHPARTRNVGFGERLDALRTYVRAMSQEKSAQSLRIDGVISSSALRAIYLGCFMHFRRIQTEE